MVRINFNLRHQRSGEDSPINIVLRWNGERLVHPSGERIDPRYWSTKDQRAKRTYLNYSDFNISLSNLATEIEKSFRAITEELNRLPTGSELKDRLNKTGHLNKENRPVELLEYIEQFIEHSRNKVNPVSGETMATTTVKKYQTTFNHLKEFAKVKKRAITFGSIDLHFYDQFNSFLTTEKGMAMNSVGKYIQTLKTFLRSAEESGESVNQSYRTKRFRTPSEITDKVYLTVEELNELFHLDLTQNKRLEHVRDLFIVGAWTGLRFSDFSKIQPEQITGGRLRIRTEKTGTTVVIPLHACVRAIMDKYRTLYSNSLPPAISNQKMNEYLKEVAKMVESLRAPVMISSTVAGSRKSVAKKKYELVTTHTARRSFATNMYKMGTPTRSIMAITGHQSESSFRAYIRLDSDEHADIIQLIMDNTMPLAVVK